jgi:hypothetical protein
VKEYCPVFAAVCVWTVALLPLLRRVMVTPPTPALPLSTTVPLTVNADAAAGITMSSRKTIPTGSESLRA